MSRRLIHYRDGKSHPLNHRKAVGAGRMGTVVATRWDDAGRAVEWRRGSGINTGKVCSLPMKTEKVARILRRLPHLKEGA